MRTAGRRDEQGWPEGLPEAQESLVWTTHSSAAVATTLDKEVESLAWFGAVRDTCRTSHGRRVLVLSYVDDLLVTGEDYASITSVVDALTELNRDGKLTFLGRKFEITVLMELFTGLEVRTTLRTITG